MRAGWFPKSPQNSLHPAAEEPLLAIRKPDSCALCKYCLQTFVLLEKSESEMITLGKFRLNTPECALGTCMRFG